jgi:hypothetical protein
MTTKFSKNSALGAAVLSSLLALSFNASAERPAHPILDTSTGATSYSGALSKQIANTGVDLGSLLAGGAVTTLEAALKQPLNRPQMVYYPKDARVGEALVGFVVPPLNQYNTATIPFCVGTGDGRIALQGGITTTGQIVTYPPQAMVAISDKTNPCRAFLKAEGSKWLQTPPTLAGDKGQKPPVAKATLKP